MHTSLQQERQQDCLIRFAKELLLVYCESDRLSEEGLREFIEEHGLNRPHETDDRFFKLVCDNERVTEGIIQCLLEYFPDAIRETEMNDWFYPYIIGSNKNVTLNIIRLLIDAAPSSVRNVNNDGQLPLHGLCLNGQLNETLAIEVLKLFLEKHPEAIRHADNAGNLPIHLASLLARSPEFCRVLIDAYPGSERISEDSGMLPFHCACFKGTVATVEYLYKLYPDAVNQATTSGFYPIHFALYDCAKRGSSDAVEIVKFLLDCDPNVKLQILVGMSLLHFACLRKYSDSTIDAGILVINALYDAHPEAIEDNAIASEVQRFHQKIQTIINNRLEFARQASDHRAMSTRDDFGQLQLHFALQIKSCLGSIKLMVKGNPAALQSPDNSGALPLHVACQHHDSPRVVQYLVELDTTTLDSVDGNGNTALHYACRGAKYETIAMLLENYDAVSVSKRNAHKKLPIDLLWESNEVQDRETIEYTESIFRLLKAYPETVTSRCMQKEQSVSVACSSQSEKKRKLFGHEE
eukprot:scaffold12513_cov103-Skeletonema_dohrnii-CCMP3373.AAC.6